MSTPSISVFITFIISIIVKSGYKTPSPKSSLNKRGAGTVRPIYLYFIPYIFFHTAHLARPDSEQYDIISSNPTPTKEVCLSFSETMLNHKKSKKIFCCFNIKLYFCTHEREITKSHRSYYTDAPTHYITSYIGSLHSHSLAVQDYPKIFSAINLAGNSKPAIT